MTIAALPSVSYSVEVSAGSWRPLASSDIEKTVEHAALEVLTRPGLMQLERAAKGGATGDYRLGIRSHVLDEAETHTVYLDLGPGTKSDLPSLDASHTVQLSKRSRSEMLTLIEDSARKAAARLVEAMKGPLARAGRGDEADPPEEPAGPKIEWQWAPVRIPAVDAGRAAKDLYAKKAELRQAALRELTSLALSDAAPRNVLERCVLEHFDGDTRQGCLVALRPLSRRIEPTRRVVIQAYRKDRDDGVRREAEEQMQFFTGASKAEAIQAFVESAAKGVVPGPLDGLGDVPNLDVAIRDCLMAKPDSVGERPQSSCLSLMDPLPHRRRVAILWRFLRETNEDSPYYLRGAGEREGSIGTAWENAVKVVLEKARRWDPKLGDILWERYRRTLSSSSLSILASHAPPSEVHADRMLEAVQTAGARDALWSLKRIGEEDAKLRPKIVEKLSELLAMGTYPKSVSKHQLEETLRELSK